MKNTEPNSFRLAMPGSHHPSFTNDSYRNRLSDRAFYLIALAVLLQKSTEPGSLHNFLVPGGQPDHRHPQVSLRG